MKKVLIILLSVFVLTGCGNKSNSELVDIEQFRCQDDIETVFNVLGKVDMKTNAFGSEHYKYENLNLFGYNGTVYFDVRDNKKTIQEIECHLILTDKEFENVLSHFSDRYGSYEVDNHSENTKVYKWKVDDKETESLGYNDVYIQYNDKNKYTIMLNDDMSSKTDEFYYESLKEKELKKEEDILKTIKTDELIIENDRISISLLEGKEELTIAMICNIENSGNAAYVHYMLSNIMATEQFKKLNPSYIITTEDDRTIAFIENISIMGIYKDEIFDVGQWFADETMASIDRSDEIESYWEQIEKFMVDFFE